MHGARAQRIMGVKYTSGFKSKKTPHAARVQRIMGVKYSFPSSLHLSRECVDLITKIFVANPANRISIGGIRAHPWFLKNLPEELQARAACNPCTMAAQGTTHDVESWPATRTYFCACLFLCMRQI